MIKRFFGVKGLELIGLMKKIGTLLSFIELQLKDNPVISFMGSWIQQCFDSWSVGYWSSIIQPLSRILLN